MKIIITFSFKWSFWHKRVYDFHILSFDETFKLEEFNGWALKEYLWKELIHQMHGWSSNRDHFRIISISRL